LRCAQRQGWAETDFPLMAGTMEGMGLLREGWLKILDKGPRGRRRGKDDGTTERMMAGDKVRWCSLAPG
jgi:hypothetical protein